MSPVTHFLSGWVLANGVERPKDRLWVSLGAVVADVDGFGLPFEYLSRNSGHPLNWFSDYHHLLTHNLAAAVIFAGLAQWFTKRWKTALFAFAGFQLHIALDLAGARGPDGYQWPIRYFWPFANTEWSWSGQWALNSWQNVDITMALLLTTFTLAWYRGFSPLETISRSADHAFIDALRKRFGVPTKR